MARTSLSVQWIFHMLCSATKKWKIKKNTLNLVVSIVNFKSSYFPAAWTSSQTGCKCPPKMARCTSVKAGSATSCCLRLPSLWHGALRVAGEIPLHALVCALTEPQDRHWPSDHPPLLPVSCPPTSLSPLPGWALPCGLLMWLSLWVEKTLLSWASPLFHPVAASDRAYKRIHVKHKFKSFWKLFSVLNT